MKKYLLTLLLLTLLGTASSGTDRTWHKLDGKGNFNVAWNPNEGWYEAGDAALDPNDPTKLVGKKGRGVMINGDGKKEPTNWKRSLSTKYRDFEDIELHVEFMVAKGSNSGVTFHGLHEIQILDTAHLKEVKATHCGGIYPPSEGGPKPQYAEGGAAPKVNAAKPPGEWQTLDVIFQAARFNKEGKMTAPAKFVKVVLNGKLIHENIEVPRASGTNWRERKPVPKGPVSFQGNYGPIAFRNISVRKWDGTLPKLNVPPEGFVSLFNGKDLTGWRVHPYVKEMWEVKDGTLQSHKLAERWGCSLATEKEFTNFVLLAEFRFPTTSDSGILFRKIAPSMGNHGDMEQFNLRSRGGAGHLESFHFIVDEEKKRLGITEENTPKVPFIDPAVGVWHTVKIKLVGRKLTTELDGVKLHDEFEYPKGVLAPGPSRIQFQKHKFFEDANLGSPKHPCPIEYRNLFIKELP